MYTSSWGNLNTHGRIILNWSLEKNGVKACNGLNWFRIRNDYGIL
jgi:hypothetical protein